MKTCHSSSLMQIKKSLIKILGFTESQGLRLITRQYAALPAVIFIEIN